MKWLLEHALLGSPVSKAKDDDEEEGEEGEKEIKKWERILLDENRLFKLDEGLKYPISLENLRFQVHVFRRM